MSQTNIRINTIILLLLIIIGVFIAFILLNLHGKTTKKHTDPTILNWNPDETISITYDQCKNINRSKLINRIIKDSFKLPMCPESYVVLYDKHQNIVFKFNENKYENPKILTVDVACDNSTGKC